MRGLPFAALWLVACGASSEPASAPAAETVIEAPVQAAPSAEVAPPTAPEPGAVGECASDADCGWDDDCVPHRCVASPREASACEESAPPPGTCSCFLGRCALRPNEPPVDDGDIDCESYGPAACGLDIGGARCVPGLESHLTSSGPRWSGPVCWCDSRLPRRCRFDWVDAVECTTNDDCWFEVDPILRPIARPPRLRGRAFRPCRDGEHAPVCSEGRCSLIGYGC